MTPSPTASSSPVNELPPQSTRQRRNAMANVMDGMSAEDINLIRMNAQACLDTARPTCVSATSSSPMPSRRSTSSSSFGDMELEGSTDVVNESGLAALALQSSSSPLQSPSLRHRRNGLANVLADVDQETLSRIRAAKEQQSSSQHESEDGRLFAF